MKLVEPEAGQARPEPILFLEVGEFVPWKSSSSFGNYQFFVFPKKKRMTVAQIVTFGIILVTVAVVVVVAVLVSRATRSGPGRSCAVQKCASGLLCSGIDQKCKIPTGDKCRVNEDCEGGLCKNGKCQVPLTYPPPAPPSTPVSVSSGKIPVLSSAPSQPRSPLRPGDIFRPFSSNHNPDAGLGLGAGLQPVPVAGPVARPILRADGTATFCTMRGCPTGTKCGALGLWARPLASSDPGWTAQGRSYGDDAFARLAAVGPWVAGLTRSQDQAQGQVWIWSGTAWNILPIPRGGGLGMGQAKYQAVDLAGTGPYLYVLYRTRGLESKRRSALRGPDASFTYRMVRFERRAQSAGGWELVPSPVSFDLTGAPISIDAVGNRTAVLNDQGMIWVGGPGFMELRQRVVSDLAELKKVRLGLRELYFTTADGLYRYTTGGAQKVSLLSGVENILDLTTVNGSQLLVSAVVGGVARLMVVDVSSGQINTYSDLFDARLRTTTVGDQLIIQGARCEPV